jgi:hypothetical protein
MPERSDTPIVLPAPLREERPKSGGPEKRAHVRFPFTETADALELRSQTRVTGRCTDLSAGGCYVDTLCPFAVGSVVRIRIEHDTRKFEASAVVAYAHGSLGMGLSFTDIKREHQGVLRFWISDLSGESISEPASPMAEPKSAEIDANANTRMALNELIYLLVRKKIISENEGTELIRQMLR